MEVVAERFPDLPQAVCFDTAFHHDLPEPARRLPLPRYIEIAREGPDHAPRFTAEVQIDGVAPERGHGANKRAAEQAAAPAMLLREGVWRAPHP